MCAETGLKNIVHLKFLINPCPPEIFPYIKSKSFVGEPQLEESHFVLISSCTITNNHVFHENKQNGTITLENDFKPEFEEAKTSLEAALLLMYEGAYHEEYEEDYGVEENLGDEL